MTPLGPLIDLTGNIIVPGTAIIVMATLAIWVGRKLQQIEDALVNLGSIAKIVDEHCARLLALEVLVRALKDDLKPRK